MPVTTSQAFVPPGRQRFQVSGMHCASCVARIESSLTRTFPGLSSVQVHLLSGVTTLEGELPAPEAVCAHLATLGYKASLLSEEANTPAGKRQRQAENGLSALEQAKIRLLTAIGLSVPVMLLHMGPWHELWWSGWAQFLLTTPILAYSGQEIFQRAWRQARQGQSTMDTLIALGAGVAWLYSAVNLVVSLSESAGPPHSGGLYFETSGMIVTLVLLGRFLEARARSHAGNAVASLMQLQPATVGLLNPDGSLMEMDAGSIPVDSHIRIRPGERVALDGVVLTGRSQVDESMVTGESRSIVKGIGDTVLAGTLNLDGVLDVQTRKVLSESTIQQMICLVERAQNEKPPVQRLADQVAGVFVPIVLVIALITGGLWLGSGADWGWALRAAIAVLVVSCPCALGLATPTAIQVGLGRGASLGILIRDPAGIEQAHALDVMVLDKTGTLTVGQPTVTAVHDYEPFPAGLDRARVLSWAAQLESYSEHPLAQAVRRYARTQEGSRNPGTATIVTNVEVHSGQGLRGIISNRPVCIGHEAFLRSQGVSTQALQDTPEFREATVLVAIDHQLVCALQIEDALRPDAASAIQSLRQLGMRPLMLSGDRLEIALKIGHAAGLHLSEIIAGVRPDEKLSYVKRLQANGNAKVGMIGDGINDAPALAQADVSMAMGTGTDMAMQTAQITLVQGSLRKAVDAVQLSRQMMTVIRQNLFWAFIYNLIAIPAAALGVLHPMAAAGAMALSSLCVVLNSLRLRRFKPAQSP